MKRRLGEHDPGVDVSTRPGSLGQYDVVVDGEVVATRSRGFSAILGGGWPTADQVVDAIDTSRSGSGS